MKALLREPLLHFALIAAMVFAVDYARGGSGDPRRVITIDDELRGELIALFVEGQSREPTADELESLIYRWIQNEVMFRQALELGLDQGDNMIRERMVMKMRTVVFNNIAVPEPDEATLAEWFERQRARYDQPRRLDFVQFMPPGVDDADAASAVLAELEDGPVPGRFENLQRRYRSLSRENIATTFGEPFAAGLAEAAPGQWLALESNLGWHLVRIERVHPPVRQRLEDVRPRVLSDWKQLRQQESAFDQIREIRDGYRIRVEPSVL